MTMPRSYLRNITTADLNRCLADCDDLARRFTGMGDGTQPADLDDQCNALRAEKDRRLADPNSSDFRPTFF